MSSQAVSTVFAASEGLASAFGSGMHGHDCVHMYMHTCMQVRVLVARVPERDAAVVPRAPHYWPATFGWCYSAPADRA